MDSVKSQVTEVMRGDAYSVNPGYRAGSGVLPIGPNKEGVKPEWIASP